jgi:glycosyltransferase involved in cell wall biosynthesis
VRVALVPPCGTPRCDALAPQLRAIAAAVVRRGGEVDVLTSHDDPRLPPVESDDGAVIRRLSLSAGLLPFRMARAVSKHLAGDRYDVVHTDTQDALLAIGASRDGPARVVFTPNVSVRRLLHGTYGPATAWVLRRSAGIVCRTDVEAEVLERLLPTLRHRVAVVPAGVDTAAIRSAAPIPVSGNVVLSVGPFERHRQLGPTIAALAALGDDFTLVAIGAGPARRSLESFAADLQVRSRVHFLGRRSLPELYGWLRTARVLVAPAADPGFPLSVLEAIAAGTPVVASDVPMHRAVAGPAGHAAVRLIPLESSPLAITDAIDAAARTTLAMPPVDVIPSLAETAERIVDVYEDVVGRRPLMRDAADGRRAELRAGPVPERADVDLSGAA